MRTNLVMALLAAAISLSAAENYQTGNFESCRRAAERGDAEAQNILGLLYANGRKKIPGDVITRKAALELILLGKKTEQARLDPDSKAAFQWFSKAAQQGNADAQYNLGYCHYKAIGTIKNPGEAFRWFSKAAEQGHVEGQKSLGVMYFTGLYIPRDDRQAIAWYEKAAQQGDPFAQTSLGMIHESGWGVPKNDAAALQWYRKAAEQDDPYAQYKTGILYVTGRGDRKNLNEGLKWLRKSAAWGYEPARRAVANLAQSSL